jgi:signal transduction histidine kinase
VDISASPLFDGNGKIEGIIENYRDITERVRSQEKLQKYSKELEESNSLKDLFTDIIQHDILNFIQIISLKIELIESEENLSLPTKEGFALISKNITNINELVANATKYALLEKKEDLDFEKLDIFLILQKAVNNLNNLQPENEQRIIIEKKANYPIFCNHMISEAIINLLSNALKYSPINSKVYTGIIQKNNSLSIYIKDSGEGIPDSHKKIIFERFIRIDHKGIKGSGLGLAISKRIVELHNGRIWVEDNPAGGSIFFIEIPYQKNS